MERFVYLDPDAIFCVVTEPEQISRDEAVVILSAGMLTSQGPFRLHVEIAGLAEKLGFLCVRMDQSGRGETPARPGLSHGESVHRDYEEVEKFLASTGVTRTILVGLCSGADDALRIFKDHESVVGAVMLDGLSSKTARFFYNFYASKLLRLQSWQSLSKRLLRRASSSDVESINLRDLNDDFDMPQACRRFLERDGRLLAVFSNSARSYYNYHGQFQESLAPCEAIANLTEVFMPKAQHLYPTMRQRQELLGVLSGWLDGSFEKPR